MKIERIEVLPVRLPLKRMLTLPRGASRSLDEGKQIILVRITGDDGTVGWGEAGPSRRWSAETIHSCYTTIMHYLAPAITGHDAFDIAGIHRTMNTELAPGADPGQPIAKAAIDLAVHDLVCKGLGINLQSWLGTKASDRIPLACLISAPTPEAVQELVLDGKKQGFMGFKLKVGHDLAMDIEIVKAAVEAAPGCTVWPDANQGYTLDQALRAARAFEALGIKLFEQPIPMSDIYGMKKLVSGTSMNIAIDEAAMGIPYLIEMIRREAVGGVVIKINKVGGIYYARQMCDLVRNAGFKLIGSGLMDAPIGFQASVQMFAGYGIDFPADLNGPQHIAKDYLAEPLPRDGQDALVTQTPGIGMVIDEDRVRGELKLELTV